MRKSMAIFAAALVAVLQCHAQYHPLEVADACACGPAQYCNVVGRRTECVALPASCGTRPSCDCIGSSSDACRDYDGHLTLIAPRGVGSCEACASEELCLEGVAPTPVCRVVPPRCEPTPSCECILASRNAANLDCREHGGRLVASLHR